MGHYGRLNVEADMRIWQSLLSKTKKRFARILNTTTFLMKILVCKKYSSYFHKISLILTCNELIVIFK